jgi:hypothetical protein
MCFGLVLSVAEPACAICFDTIAGYEPYEVSDLNVSPNLALSPTLDINWPVLGGVNDVPEATKGKYVLKLSWTNEIDRKIEVKHHWNKSSFDLASVAYISVDVYFATESALPAPENNNISIWTMWDSNTHWISCEHVPPITNEWYTVAFYVGNLNYSDLNDVNALTFENMGDPNDPNDNAGVIYIDNLQLVTESSLYPYQSPYFGRKIEFSGYWWLTLQSEWPIGAGPSCFTDAPNDIWVDPNEHLHLSIIYKDPNWFCSEVVCNENFGYGTYVFTLRDEVNSLDPNIILGPFIYDVPDAIGKPREIDFEFTRWGNPNDPNNAQYAVQPANEPNLLYRFRIDYSADTKTTTHVVTWKPSRIDFSSYYGDYTPHPRGKNIIDFWSYTGDDIPKPGCENPRINFYLMDGHPPVNGQNAEMVIKRFRYLPLGDLDNDYDVDFVDFALFSQKWLLDVK